jgi:hypothetical protein
MKIVEPPYDCQLCRMELADRILDNVENDITVSFATFIVSFNAMAVKYGLDTISLSRALITEIHASHSGGEDA